MTPQFVYPSVILVMTCGFNFLLIQQRLQNPKIEKAAILDLAVEYLRSWTDGQRNGW